MITILSGLLAGTAHVVSGPDHLAGVAPLTIGSTVGPSATGQEGPRIPASLVGASWGFGHGLGVALLGTAAQLIMTTAQIEMASGWADRLVGLILIILGALTVRRSRGLTIHEHVHEHGGNKHVHMHAHTRASHEGKLIERNHTADHKSHGHCHAAMGIGLVHGTAGGGHFWGVIPSLALPPGDAAIYIGGYLVATVIVMAFFAELMSRLARRAGRRRLPQILRSIGIITMIIGLGWLAWRI